MKYLLRGRIRPQDKNKDSSLKGAGHGARSSLNDFLHGDAIDMELASRSLTEKGRALTLSRKLSARRWFPTGTPC